MKKHNVPMKSLKMKEKLERIYFNEKTDFQSCLLLEISILKTSNL